MSRIVSVHKRDDGRTTGMTDDGELVEMFDRRRFADIKTIDLIAELLARCVGLFKKGQDPSKA